MLTAPRSQQRIVETCGLTDQAIASEELLRSLSTLIPQTTTLVGIVAELHDGPDESSLVVCGHDSAALAVAHDPK